MRCLVTGGAGFAGAHALEHLLKTTDWDVVCTDSFRHKGKTDRITGVLDANPSERHRVSVVTHDLTAPVSAQMARRIGEVGYVLAYASESHVDRSITDPVPFVMNNVAVALSTLEYARAARPAAVVLVSTDEVYGAMPDGWPFPEWAPILPSNPYSASKAAAEAVAISYWRTYGVPVVLVNCTNLIGERQDAEKYTPKVLRACLRGEEIAIHGRPGDIGTRYYMHARNLADGILFLLRERPPAMFAGGADRPDRYNISPQDRVDNLTYAQMIAGIAGKPLRWRLEDFPDERPGHDPHYGLDPGKITALGWKPPVPLAESLEKTVRWYMAHEEWLEG